MSAQHKHTLRFLGTGASCGVPSFYCGCKACEEALKNPAARRGCAALLISGTENTLIDAGPDLRMQLSLAGARDIERVLFTHEHADHIDGISELEYYVRLKTGEPLPIYAGDHTLENIAKRFGYMSDTLEPHGIEVWQSLEFDGVRYTVLPAAHGTQTFGFLIEKTDDAPAGGSEEQAGDREGLDAIREHRTVGPSIEGTAGKRIAYFPDTGPLSSEVREVLRGIDILIIDATFHGTNWMPASHLTIDEAIQTSQQVHAEKTFLTHLSMHYDEPITALELQVMLASFPGVVLAANDGLEITF